MIGTYTVGTYNDVLVGTVVTLGYQCLESKYSEDDYAQGKGGDGHERYLQELAHDLLPLRVVMLVPAAAVHDDPLPSKLGARDLDSADALDVPFDAEVGLPDFPMLKKDGAPDSGGDGIHEGVIGQELPRQKPGDGREGKKYNIGLNESKVKGHLVRPW
jgi:hypothetical protein